MVKRRQVSTLPSITGFRHVIYCKRCNKRFLSEKSIPWCVECAEKMKIEQVV